MAVRDGRLDPVAGDIVIDDIVVGDIVIGDIVMRGVMGGIVMADILAWERYPGQPARFAGRRGNSGRERDR